MIMNEDSGHVTLQLIELGEHAVRLLQWSGTHWDSFFLKHSIKLTKEQRILQNVITAKYNIVSRNKPCCSASTCACS